MTYQAPESVSLDHEYPADVFVLENTFGLPEVDLDAKQKNASVPNPPKRPSKLDNHTPLY